MLLTRPAIVAGRWRGRTDSTAPHIGSFGSLLARTVRVRDRTSGYQSPMTNDDDRQPATAVDNEATHRQSSTRSGPGKPDRPAPASDAHIANEDEVAREFPHGDGRPLREQRSLIDEDGDDIRQYTGEPVETEDGWVLPQQMATGNDNVVGNSH